MAKRRGNNEGSIYQTKDGRWRGAVTLPSGKRKYPSGKTRAEVTRKVKELQAQVDKSVLPGDARLTLGQLLDRWLHDTVKPMKAPRTYEFYESKTRLYIKPLIGGLRLAKLSPHHVQRMMAEMLDRGLSPQSVTHTRRVLSAALSQAKRWGLVSRNVAEAELVDNPRVDQYEGRQFTQQEASAFLRSLEDDRLEGLYRLALGLGLRKGELLGLCWEDVDLEEGKLRVVRTLQDVRGEGLRLLPPKTKRSQRTLPLAPEMVSMLRKHRALQYRLRLAAGSRWKGWDGGELVFTTTIGTPITPSNLSRHFKRALEKADLPDIRFHDLRGTFGTLLASRGVAPRTLMELMGHSKISTTMEIYAKALPEDKQDAIESMQILISGTN